MKREVLGAVIGLALLAFAALAAGAEELTVNSILAAQRSGASPHGIITMDNNPSNTIAMTAGDLVTLRDAGVPEAVTTALWARVPAPTPAPVPLQPDDARLVDLVRLIKSGISESITAEQVKQSDQKDPNRDSMTTPATATPVEGTGRLPRQIPYIIGNEACERFGFYGMRNILVQFLVGSVLLAYIPDAQREGAAEAVFHSFVIGVYFFPLLGLDIRPLFRQVQHHLLAVAGVRPGLRVPGPVRGQPIGLLHGPAAHRARLGRHQTAGVCLRGRPVRPDQQVQGEGVYDAFYWTINFGSFFASLLMPLFLSNYGPAIAFGIPGALMCLSVVIFWAGRNKYTHVPPSPANPHSFLTSCARPCSAGRRARRARGWS